MDKKKKLELELLAAQIRLETTRQIATRGFGHLPGSLSVADTVAVLYGEVMKYKPEDPRWDGRDYLVMSKGHAGPTLYSTLAIKGFFPMEELKTLNQPGTNLPSHCDKHKTIGIDATTGSLGQGASVAMGMATGVKLAGKENHVYLFVGDGECDEGQVWEAFLYAAQQKLDNLTVFIDYNRKQLDGYTRDVIELGSLEDKMKAFGFHAEAIDGHDIEAIYDAIQRSLQVKGQPSCIVLNTIKGKGIPKVEEMELNHHITLEGEMAGESIALLEAEYERLKGEYEHV